MSEKPGTNRPAWISETTHPELTERLKENLKDIIDPEIGYNVLQLGLIRDVTIQDDQAIVRMILTTPFCPYGPAMLESVRQKSEEALARPTSIDLGMDMWDFSMMEEGLGDWGLY
jgi:metal-sulfur cluster biosynthetic enzyme